MITNNFAMQATKIIGEAGRDILFFPLWWYARGLLLFIRRLLVFLQDRERSLALLVWIKNVHRPMYGQYDWQGKLISFFMRIVQIIFRSIIMLFWLIMALAAFCFWIILPIFVIYEIIFQLNA